MPTDLRVLLGRLSLRAPVLAAAGTVGYGLEFGQVRGLERLGALITKTLTREPRDGARPPRLAETPSGMLNAVGLQNIGLEAFLEEKLPALRALNVPMIVSLLGESPDELGQLCQRLETASAVAAVEVNLSCPNVRHAGEDPWAMVAHDPAATEAFVRAARRATTKPLLVKLSPDVTDIAPIARAAEQAGADALTIANTYRAMRLDPSTRHSQLGALTGGLSGPAIRPLTLLRVYRAAQAVRCPIIGLGGIVRLEDALEYFLAGASAVAVGTAHFADPAASVRLADALARYLARRRLETVRALVGGLAEPS